MEIVYHKDSFPLNPVLIVDDEQKTLDLINAILHNAGVNNTILCSDSRQVEGILNKTKVELVLLDLNMPNINGNELLPKVISIQPNAPVIIITGVNEIEIAVACMQRGAFDYIVKPDQKGRLVSAVSCALEMQDLRRVNKRLSQIVFKDALDCPDSFSDIVTRSKLMLSIFQYCEAIAEGRQPVLITGETGTGKELIAHALHKASKRKGNYICVNIAGIDDHMFSDTLFGHTKGAFTSALTSRKGLIEQAEDGTLFLDEIGDLPEQSQVRLLRLIQDREYYTLGSDIIKTSKVRIITATNQNIKDHPKFRKDLYYRLSTHHIKLPPLKDRKDDIPLLFDHFLEMASKEYGKNPPKYTKTLIELLMMYNFPGNVRELKSIIFDAVSQNQSHVLSLKVFKQRCSIPSISDMVAAGIISETEKKSWVSSLEPLPLLKEAMNDLIQEALKRSNNNQSIAARLLGISHQALNKRLKKTNTLN